VGIVRLVAFQTECDKCAEVLTDYGRYYGMESPEAAARFAVEEKDWVPLLDGRTLTGLLCPSCGGDERPSLSGTRG